MNTDSLVENLNQLVFTDNMVNIGGNSASANTSVGDINAVYISMPKVYVDMITPYDGISSFHCQRYMLI